MKRTCAASMKRSYSCMDLAALEADASSIMSSCSKKRLTTPPRYRSLSSGPASRQKNINEWLHTYDSLAATFPAILESPSIEDILSASSIASILPPPTGKEDTMQLELIDMWQQPWIVDKDCSDHSTRLL
ncbi:hypothetical protein LEN26_001275 [Aphanomyces euteiches]|nr:hypothetical protein AeMF1_004180 [Aphanomyces euteiches]KAH9161748.1 hypothetical protein LEN26_001275 [Aphanomyces euteiches]KAH9185512.1 hypothetical protein AeNC1_012512 [Aphanomyces euteiches]